MLVRSQTESDCPSKQFSSAHFQGYTDHLTGKQRRVHFVSEASERGYISGWAMADLSQGEGGYWFQDKYWRIYTRGMDDTLYKYPYKNLYAPGTWQHVAYISGVQAALYLRRK